MAREVSPGCFQLDGAMPWVTAAERADVFITGALLDDDRQVLIALPADRPGLTVKPPFDLAALQASCTGEVVLSGRSGGSIRSARRPERAALPQPGTVGTAGLETSALALGQALRRTRGHGGAGRRKSGAV